MGDFSDLQRGQIVDTCLAGASVMKQSLLGAFRAAVSKVMMSYTNHGRTSSAKRNSGRKQKLSERDHHILKRIVTTNHSSTAAEVRADLNFFLRPFPQKQSDRSVTNPPSMVRLQLLNL